MAHDCRLKKSSQQKTNSLKTTRRNPNEWGYVEKIFLLGFTWKNNNKAQCYIVQRILDFIKIVQWIDSCVSTA